MLNNLYLEKQLYYELKERYYIPNSIFLNSIQEIEIKFKTIKLIQNQYTLNYVIRHAALLNMFSGSFWLIKKYIYKLTNKSISSVDTNGFFLLYSTVLYENDISKFLDHLYIFLIFKKKLNKNMPIIQGFLRDNIFTFYLSDIQNAPWVSPNVAVPLNIRLRINIKIKNKRQFEYLLSRFGLLSFIKIKKK